MISVLSERAVRSRYVDPLDELWTSTADRLGLRIERSQGVYASTDGRGTLVLSDPAGMDPDDCLAQMVLHEICHSLVGGPESFGWVDWGLNNETLSHQRFELATLRVQAALLEPYGLRHVLGPTTDYRAYYDAIPADPFLERSSEERESVIRARAAFARRNQKPWAPHLELALDLTREILERVAGVVAPDRNEAAPTLLRLLEPRAPRNKANLPLFPSWRQGETPGTCGDCAWLSEGPRGRTRCLAAGRNQCATEPSCEHFEKREQVNCASCGACCREAYQVVLVSRRDPRRHAIQSHLKANATGYELRRNGNRCSALKGGQDLETQRPFLGGPGPSEQTAPPFAIPGEAEFSCEIYADRPKTCRDFALRGPNCLAARRRVGLSH